MLSKSSEGPDWDIDDNRYFVPLTYTLEANGYSSREVSMILYLVRAHIADEDSSTGKVAGTFSLNENNYSSYGFDYATFEIVSTLFAGIHG